MLEPHRRKTPASGNLFKSEQEVIYLPKINNKSNSLNTVESFVNWSRKDYSSLVMNSQGSKVNKTVSFHLRRKSFFLVVVTAILVQVQVSQASIWPFSGGSSHKSSESGKRELQSQANDGGQWMESGAALQSAPSMAQQFHYFWNHDKIEPKVVAQEAIKVLADAQLQTNHKTMQALSEARRSSDDSSSKMEPATSGSEAVISESVPAPVAALIPSALQQQLTSLVLQMQRQLQQQTSLLAQPRLDLQSRMIRQTPIPLSPTSRFWPSQIAPIISPEMLAAESMQLSSNPLVNPLRVASPIQPIGQIALPGTSLAGVPIYGPYTIQPAASLIRPTMIRPRSINFPVRQLQVRPPLNQAKSSTSRRKSWPFYSFTDKIPFFMSSAASQPKVTVVGPPSSTTLSQRSNFNKLSSHGTLNNSDKQTLLELTSNQLATAISSHLQARAAQRKLVSLLSQVIEQPPKHQQTSSIIPASSIISARYAQPDHSSTIPGRMSYIFPISPIGGVGMSAPQSQISSSIDYNASNNSSNDYGNRLNRRQLNSALPENYTMESVMQKNDLLREFKSNNSSRTQTTRPSSDVTNEHPPNHRMKRSAAWTPSGFLPMSSQMIPATSVPPATSSTKPQRQPKSLRVSPITSLTANGHTTPLLMRRNLANLTSANQEQVTTVSSIQIPDSPLDWSTPTKRSEVLRAAKVKRVVSSGTVFHHSVILPTKSGESSKFSVQDSTPKTGPLHPLTSALKPPEDIMNGSAAESARVINYFQDVEADRTTTKSPDSGSVTIRPNNLNAQNSMDFSSSVNRYKSNRKANVANETSDDNNNSGGSRYISGRGNGLQAPSGANYVPRHSTSGGRGQTQSLSAANNGPMADISSSATRSVSYSVTNSAATSGDSIVSKPGQLETSSSKIGSGSHALVGSITRTSSSGNQQMDSSLSDMDGQDMQVKLLDSLLAKENSGRSSSSSYATTPPPQMLATQQQSQQSSSGNDRSPSADQSGSYNEELLPPSFGSSMSSDQNFQDALEQGSMSGSFGVQMNQQDFKQSSHDSGLSQMTESTRQQSPMQSMTPVQSQQTTYNMTQGEWVSGPSVVTAEQPMEIGSNSFQNLNQMSALYPEEQSQYLNYPMVNSAASNPLLYQPSLQRQFYTQQLQALGSAVNRYNQNRFNYQQPSFAASRNFQVQTPKEMYSPLRNDFNHINWANLEDGLLHQSAVVPSSIAYGDQNVANMIAFPGAVASPNVNDARNYMMAGSEQSRSESGDDSGSSKTKRTKSKPIKQVSHHYHINNFGFPMEDTDNPLDIAAAFATNPGLSYPKSQNKPAKPVKSPKEEEKQNEEEEEKPRKKKFLRRFSFKNLFKKLKKDKKKENVEGGEEESGNGGGEESSEERKSRLY